MWTSEVGPHPTQVPSRAPSRELRNNVLEHDKGVCDVGLAHHRSRQGPSGHRPKLKPDTELRVKVQAKPSLKWSPEQITAHLRILWPDQPERHLRHETIYRALARWSSKCANTSGTGKAASSPATATSPLWPPSWTAAPACCG